MIFMVTQGRTLRGDNTDTPISSDYIASGERFSTIQEDVAYITLLRSKMRVVGIYLYIYQQRGHERNGWVTCGISLALQCFGGLVRMSVSELDNRFLPYERRTLPNSYIRVKTVNAYNTHRGSKGTNKD